MNDQMKDTCNTNQSQFRLKPFFPSTVAHQKSLPSANSNNHHQESEKVVDFYSSRKACWKPIEDQKAEIPDVDGGSGVN
ncbi:unnamed protein product [Lactuca virosa]|uniref:Uncharacterized protein n=1 Tax=Lactuca virosa TaxID=75947 RepID=A0AAU9LYE8_9ASTR|nr:unnamed protein product [Lactuca virosa]